MFPRSFTQKSRVSKPKLAKAPSFRANVRDKMLERMEGHPAAMGADGPQSPPLTAAIVTIVVGQEQRLFAAHEDVLAHSPYLAAALHDQFLADGGASSRKIHLPDEEPEIFAAILEYLYKGDYTPRLLHDKRRNTWQLEGAVVGSPDLHRQQQQHRRGAGTEPTIYHPGVGAAILRDTAVYCAAGRYGLEELQRLALRKQGLQSGIEVATILRSARYAYDRTPDSDSRLRAHYLALIIRSRRTFKRSGTMQLEMEMGGKLFFDLFVAMCNHMDDLADVHGSPRTV